MHTINAQWQIFKLSETVWFSKVDSESHKINFLRTLCIGVYIIHHASFESQSKSCLKGWYYSKASQWLCANLFQNFGYLIRRYLQLRVADVAAAAAPNQISWSDWRLCSRSLWCAHSILHTKLILKYGRYNFSCWVDASRVQMWFEFSLFFGIFHQTQHLFFLSPNKSWVDLGSVTRTCKIYFACSHGKFCSTENN